MLIVSRSFRALPAAAAALLLILSQGLSRADDPPAAPAPAWIWLGDEFGENQSVGFRTQFEVPGRGVAAARLYIAVDNAAEVFINGQPVLKHDSWSAVAFKDVTTLVAPGKNVLAVLAGNSEGPAGLLCQLVVETQRRDITVVSSADWRAAEELPDGWTTKDFDASAWAQATVLAPLGGGPWRSVTAQTIAAAAELKQPEATPLSQIKAAKGFEVELLYSVPQDQQGSWVNMCVDPQGRLIVSDQYGGLFRVTPAAKGESIGFQALGVSLKNDEGVTRIHEIVSGGAADRDGRLQAGDRLLAVSRGDEEWQETASLQLGEVVEALRGAFGDKEPHTVRLRVQGDGEEVEEIELKTTYITLPGQQAAIEKLDLPIGEAQGLLWAFDSLYVVVNHGGKYESGLYRVTDSDADGELDKVEQLRKIDGGGEHGPHAVLLSPDGESLTIVCGNNTRLPEIDTYRVPPVWDEDFLIPRLYGRGFMKGVPAPAGFIARTDPDGKEWELIATGFRNEFDAAYNQDGELFAYDADMEWDMNTPWYRPTRVNHVVSGAEFGWRNGSAKWPDYYFDSLPAVVNVGPGSPTGVCFGYRADFPEKYQQALYLCDWSYGKLYAAHLAPDGSTYTGTLEEFVTGTPLPLTDAVINPHDGAMYFAIGGRRVQSGLYRVTYVGGEEQPTVTEELVGDKPSFDAAVAETLRDERRKLEALHQPTDGAVETAWPYLSHADRFIRYAARIAIEHQPVEQWQERALAESDPRASIAALLALARQQEQPPTLSNDVHDPILPDYDNLPELTGVDLKLKSQMLDALGRIEWGSLSQQDRIDLLRVYTVTLARMGPPDDVVRTELIEKFDAVYPAGSPALNTELARLLVYLQAPTAAEKTVALLERAPTQEEQIDLAMPLRYLRTGWNDDLLQRYLSWFPKALGYRGGANFTMFIDELKQNAVALLTEEQKSSFAAIINQAPQQETLVTVGPPRPVVQKWTVDELLPHVTSMQRRNFERGREMFGVAKCFACHRFGNEGGAVGPDLTSLAGRFSPRDLLESIIHPSKTVSDQYEAVQIVTLDGNVVVGRIVNLGGDSFQVNTNMLDPNALTSVDRKTIDIMEPSKVSMMPEELLNTLHLEEVLDLMAYLLSRGNPDSELFARAVSTDRQEPDDEDSGLVNPPEGFHAIFNGRDLTGWHGMPHFDPRELAQMSGEDRQAKIDEWTADAQQHWTVENGELVNDGHGAYLTTDEEFADYELLIDYKTVVQADSGIYLKSTPQVQIWDYTEAGGKWEIGADKGSGGLWNNSPGTAGKDPLVLADKPFGEWNSFRIRQVGARTSIWLNGQHVVDNAILENFWDRTAPLFRSGPIQLQTHGGEIRWRNIFVREIPAEEANEILSGIDESEFTPLFNGTDLSGWQGAVENYEVVDGAIRCKDGHGGVLFTEEMYADFVVELEFKLPPGGNNGLAIRYPGEGDPAYSGMCELQVLDTEDPRYAGLDPRQAHGSAYGILPAARGFHRPVGEWNFQRVTVQGSRVTVELNGHVILNGDLSEVTEYMANSPHPGKDRTEGYFGFAGHSDPVEFRKVKIRTLGE